MTTPGLTHPYNFASKDYVTAIIALIVGFLFWEWNVIMPFSPTLGVFIFLILVTTTTLCYLRKKGMSQNKTSRRLLGVVGLSSCYFLIFDNTPIHFFMLVFIMLMYVLWVMSVSGTSIMKTPSGFILADFVNQILVVPFNNFTALFRAFFSRDKQGQKATLSVVVGIIISIPLLFIVVTLLSQADYEFGRLVQNIVQRIWDLSLIDYILEFFLGIPVACYCFGFLYGNHYKRKVDFIKYESVNSRFIKLHAIPGSAVYGPLVVFNVIYVVFFIALASYLFSAFSGDLPVEMTYAEYARKGFFELCAVAAINLTVIAFAYTCVKRKEGEYGKTLRLLTGLLSLFTIMLVITAMSKMQMYISSYGLTRLRIYTFWFMILIIFIFILIAVWHVKRYNMGRILIAGSVVLFLVLGFSNADGIIAKYNIDAYEKGTLTQLDTRLLEDLSDAAVPYISDYINKTDDEQMKATMIQVLHNHKVNITNIDGNPLRYNVQKIRAKG